MSSTLAALGISGTLREVRTFGRTPPRREVYRGSAYFQDLTPEMELSALLDDELVESVVAQLQAVDGVREIVMSTVIGLSRAEKPKASLLAVAPSTRPAPAAAIGLRVTAAHT